MATKRFIAKNGLDNNTQTITNVADPVNAQDAATRAFVLANAGGGAGAATAETLIGATLASNVLASSLTSVGTLAGLTVTADATIKELTIGQGGTAGYSTFNNSVFGLTALAMNMMGHENTAIGAYALNENKHGNFNTAVGSDALRRNSTAYTGGDNNTAIGQRALASNQGGSSNSAVGANALDQNTGDYNTAMGMQALMDNSTGSWNTAMGHLALTYNTTGHDNSAMGQIALKYNTTGIYNAAMGMGALLNNTTGDYNAALGADAGRFIADGTTQLTVVNKSTFLGEETKASADNVTNETVIGYNAIGSGSNTFTLGGSTVTKTLIPYGNVGIGVSPSGTYKLQVSGSISATQLALAAGTTAVGGAPLKITPGTSFLTTPEAGAIEVDSVNSVAYFTGNATNGRGLIPTCQYFRLEANLGVTATTIAPFFGTSSSIPLVTNGVYEIEMECYFLKNTAGTLVWTITNSAVVTNMQVIIQHTPVAGYTTVPTTTAMTMAALTGQTAASVAFSATTSLTLSTNHWVRIKIILENASSTSLRLNVTNSAGTITPRRGSYWKATRIANVGILAT